MEYASPRLWCVFELAAYRTANPDGKITLAPLFVENGAAGCCLGAHVIVLLSVMSNHLDFSGAIALVLVFLPAYFCLHGLRYAMRTKNELIAQLSAFTLGAVDCREDFDRQYIHGAIQRALPRFSILFPFPQPKNPRLINPKPRRVLDTNLKLQSYKEP